MYFIINHDNRFMLIKVIFDYLDDKVCNARILDEKGNDVRSSLTGEEYNNILYRAIHTVYDEEYWNDNNRTYRDNDEF